MISETSQVSFAERTQQRGTRILRSCQLLGKCEGIGNWYGAREVPLSDRAVGILRQRCGDRRKGWVFPSKRARSGHLTTMALKFRQAREMTGPPKNLVLYCGRHDFGTRVLKKTGNLKLVMQTMGQVHVKAALKYQHPELDIVRTALNDTAPGVPLAAT